MPFDLAQYIAPVLSGSALFGKMFIFALIIGGMSFWVVFYFSFNMPVIVFRKHGKGTEIIHTKAKRVFDKRNNVTFYKIFRGFLNRAKMLPPPESYEVIHKSKGKDSLILYQYGEDEYAYLKYDANPGGFQHTEMDTRFWLANYFKSLYQNYIKQSFIEKYGPMLTLGIIAAVLIFGMIMLFDKLEVLKGVADALNAAAANVLEASKVQRAGGQMIPPPG